LNVSEAGFPLELISYFKPVDLDSSILNSNNLNPNTVLLKDNLAYREEFKNKVYYVLNRQLKQSASVQKQFTQRFIVYTHNASQKIINAYLACDSTELEKRQYYASLNEYGDFLKMIDLAKNLVPAQNHLATVLNINYYYLKGCNYSGLSYESTKICII
jgi:hypothetical protein